MEGLDDGPSDAEPEAPDAESGEEEKEEVRLLHLNI